jgi:hypothetical protein
LWTPFGLLLIWETLVFLPGLGRAHDHGQKRAQKSTTKKMGIQICRRQATDVQKNQSGGTQTNKEKEKEKVPF